MNLLWDFDGTLFDTYPAYTDIMFEAIGGAAPKQEIMAHLKVSFTHAKTFYHLNAEQLAEMLAKEQSLHPEKTPPFPGVEQVLRFAGTNVIMTHKPRKEASAIIRHYGWDRYFADMIAGDDGYPRKPDPASYMELHRRHRIDLVIGDRELDILPGKAIGIRTCLFQNDTPGADLYIDRYEQFFEAVRSLEK